MNPLPRVLSIDGTRNLRDVGGYPTCDGRSTRWQTVYRSDALCQLTPAAQEEFIKLGIRTIIDVREQDEIELRPNVFCTSAALNYRHLPFWGQPAPRDGVVDISHGYHRELNLRGERLASICRELVQPGALPALLHCAAGKDRTGIAVAVLLAALGVPDQTIIEDYVLSQTCLGEPYLEESRQDVISRGWRWEKLSHLYDTPPERMERTLEHLESRWGGGERYLRHHGLAATELQELRGLLTQHE